MAFEEFKGELDAPAAGGGFAPFSGELDAPAKPGRATDAEIDSTLNTPINSDVVDESAQAKPGAVASELANLRDSFFSGVDSSRASLKTVNVAAQASALQAKRDNLAQLEAAGKGKSPEAEGVRKYIQAYEKRLPTMISGMTEAQADAKRGTEMTTRPAVAELNKAKTFSEAWDIFAKNPYDVIAGVSSQSLANTIPALITGAVLGPVAGASMMGVSSAATEAGSSLGEFAGERGVDMTDPKAVEAFFTDRNNLAEAMAYAGKRAGIIGALDAASGGMAGKTMAPALKSKIARQAVNLPAQMGVQAGLGAGGEAGAQLATKGKIDQPGQVLMEAAGELSGAPMEVAAFGREARMAAREKAFAEKYPTDPGTLPGVPPAPVDPVAAIAKAQTVDEAIAAAQAAVQSSTAVDNIAQILEQNLPAAQSTPAPAATENVAGLSPEIAQTTQAITELEAANVSPSAGIQPVAAGTPGSGMPEPGISLEAPLGTERTAGPAMDAGRLPDQSDRGFVPLEPGTPLDAVGTNVQDQTPAGPATQGQAAPTQAPEARAVAGSPAAATGTATGDAAVQAAGLSARQVAIASEKARIEAQRVERAAAKAQASAAPAGLSVGMMPNTAEPVTVKNGVVYIGKYPANNFDTGADVMVDVNATLEQIRDALVQSGALGKKARVFGVPNKAQAIDGRALPATDFIATETPNAAQQRADFAASEKTRKVPGNAARTRASAENPFKAFLGKHGISNSLAAEFAPGRKERQAAMVQGYGPMFRKSGPQLDALAARAVEEGFLLTPDEAKLQALIADVLRGKRVIPQYAQGVAEDEGAARAARAADLEQQDAEAQNAEIEAENKAERDAIQAVADLPDAALEFLAGNDVVLTASNNVSEADFLRALGATEQEIEDATAKQSEGTRQGDQGRAGAEETAASAAPGNSQGRDGQAGDSEGVAKPLYASRPVTNAADIIAWAKSQGFKQTLPADDMHVTVAYSSQPLDGSKAGKSTPSVSIEGGKRTVEPLGDGGAIVLKFSSDEMQQRWKQYREAGASWDYEGYTPHVTLTYDAEGLDLSKVTPYDGPINLGPEKQEALNEDKADEYVEEPTLTSPTPADVLAQQQRATEGDKADAKATTAAADRARADAELPDFTLTGSDRAADADPNQGLMFSRAASATDILDAADIKGKDRLEALRDVRAGLITPEELEAAYPAKVDQTETEAFKRWFGASKVVEDFTDKPKVVYHGAPDVRGIFADGFQARSRGSVFFAAADYAVADSYAKDVRAFDYQNAEPQTIPLYLSVQNPMIVDAKGAHWKDTESHVQKAKDGGHDGIIIRNSIDFYNSPKGKGGKSTTVYAWFAPTQAKSAVSEQLKSRVDGKQIDGATGNNGDFDPADARIQFSRGTQTEERNALEAISQNDELFALPKSEASTVEEIAADNAPGITVKKMNYPGLVTTYALTMPDGAKANIMVRKVNPYGEPQAYGMVNREDGEFEATTDRPGRNPENVPEDTEDVYIDVSNLKEGGQGRLVYNIAATFAHNTDRILIGDPAGLSNAAMRRRTEHMLSSALKFGTTRHLAPHPRQTLGAADIGVPPLRWTYGDDLGNIKSLIEVSTKSLENAGGNPFTFDPATGTFRDSEGGAIDKRGISLVAELGSSLPGKAGGTTLQRSAVLSSLLREQGQEGSRAGQGVGILERLVEWGREHSLATKGIFYSEGSTPAVRNPSTVERVQAAVAELIGGKQLPNKLGRVIVATSADVKSHWLPLMGKNAQLGSEGEAGVAQAFFEPATKSVVLIADNIPAGDEMAVAAHELMHKHGQTVLGEDGWTKLHTTINGWANAEEDSDERAVYNYARSRVEAVGMELSSQEMFPYAVEAAIKMGVKPSLIAKKGTVARWLGSVKYAMQQAWGKVTGKPETFKTQDLVGLAFGIAQMENPESAAAMGDALRGTNEAVPAFDNASGDYNPDLDAFWLKKGTQEINGDGMPDDEYHQAVAEYANSWRVESLLETLGWKPRGSSNISSSRYYTKDIGIGEVDPEYGGYDEYKTYEVRVSDHDDYHPAADDVEQRFQFNFRAGTKQWSDADLGPDLSNTEISDRLKDILPNEPTAPDSGGAPVAQTDTPAFKKWFGDSKVVDDAGNPLVGRELAVAMYGRGASSATVAKAMGNVSLATVKRWVSDAGAQRTGSEARGGTKENRAEAVRLYAEGLGAFEIADRLGVSNRGVYNWLRDAGVEIRSLSEAQALRAAQGRQPIRGVRSTVSTKWGDIRADSVYEAARLRQLETDGDVESVARATEAIQWGDNQRYTPDFLVTMKDGGIRVEEVKPTFQQGRDDVVAKAEAAREALNSEDVDYRMVVTEDLASGFIALRDMDGLSFASDADRARFKRALATAKSAIGNNGDFDGGNPDIRYSRTATQTGTPAAFDDTLETDGWSMPEPTRADKVIYNLQDGRIDLKRVQEAIKAAGAEIAEKFNARQAETLYPGRVARRAETFLNIEVKPLLQDMALNKIDMDELGDYLIARHAPERNAQVAKVNHDLPDGGAGRNSQGVLMTDDAAAEYLAAIPATQLAKLTSLARKVDAITAGTRALLVGEGLEKQETVDAWTKAYKNYVPLFKDEAEHAHPQGRGFTVKGSASKRSTGSTKEVTNVLAHVLMQRETAITRAEKNRVGLSLYGLALSNPNTDFWTTIKPNMSNEQIMAELQAMGVDPLLAGVGMASAPTVRTVDPLTDKVVDRPNPMYKNLPGAITLRVNGEDRVLMLNQDNERAMRMAMNLKNLDGVTQLELAGSIIGKSTRWIASVNTQYNPAFGLVNVTRDTLGGIVNLTNTPLRKQKIKVLANVPAALKGIARDLRGDTRTEWSDLFNQFQDDGGQTGFKEMFRTADDRAKAIEKEIAAAGKSGMAPGKMAHAVLDLLDDFNTALENSVRLSAYKAALDQGMSRPAAAKLARELTVDFNRKGRAGREIGPLYAFFNASVQGTARTLETLAGPAGAKIIAGGLALGGLQALMLAFAGFDEDEPPEFIKSRALIIPIGGDKRYIAIPYPLGLHVIPNTGRVLTELTINGGKDIGKRSVEAIGEIAGAFNPMGGGNIFTTDGALRTLAPTIVDPLIELAANKNFAGFEIEKKPFREEGDNRPGFQRARESTQRSTTGQVYLGISKAVNAMTGGNDFEAGVSSPTPERVRYLAHTVGGGVLRELEKSINTSMGLLNDDEVTARGIPVIGRFYGEIDSDQSERSRYFESAKTIKKFETSRKAADKAGATEIADKLIQQHPELEMARSLNNVQERISKLNKKAAETINDREELKRIDEDRFAEMKGLNDELKKMERAKREPTIAERLRGEKD